MDTDDLARELAAPLRQILLRSTIRYLEIKPDGVDIEGGHRYVKTANAWIYDFGGARTLYRAKKPICRSLDGVTSIEREPKLACFDCLQRHVCTPQIRVDLLIGAQSYRCLLAFTSARNFQRYEAQLREIGKRVERVETKLTVLDRGSWGELRFEIAT